LDVGVTWLLVPNFLTGLDFVLCVCVVLMLEKFFDYNLIVFEVDK